ncbi:LPXTG cell wall anchor domain-containing protein [Microvirga tunisiensis]|uniref:LPXTG cell wall anchor domain-containing protein n=1 Tax=Pannonibacter tanglangensis TaxID=2750084 RepID=A0A7X5F5N7_9HYPH|nr:LPXTG cell wall anchor domain-containing protein [Pannonibacter sp. XCT-53]NBN80213.1 LPXTG cell wall anchor domain-containing protein [Pannonibacter sp. XCT-53]
MTRMQSLSLAALVSTPAFAQETGVTTGQGETLFTPTVIGVAIAGLVLGGVVGFIRRRKEMKK